MPSQPTYWSPSALQQRPVDYPILPFANVGPQQPNSHYDPRQWTIDHQAKAANMAARGQFMVNNALDWGGNKTVGADVRAFPNHTGVPRSFNINVPVGSGGGGGFGGGFGGNIGGLAQWYQQALDQANQANEARYRDVLGGYQSRYERGLGMLSGLGQQEARDINEASDANAGRMRQSLIGRGLGNSTILDTMLMGVDRERNADLGRLNDRMRQQALSTDAGLSGDTLQFMERKTEKGPDIGMLAQLMQGVGQAGYGGGGGAPMILDAVNANSFGYGYSPPGQYSYNPFMFGGGYGGGGSAGNNREGAAFRRAIIEANQGSQRRRGMLGGGAGGYSINPAIAALGPGYDPSWAGVGG